VVIFITLLAGFVPLLQVTFFALLEDFYPGRLAVKDRDKTPRITGVILISRDVLISSSILSSIFAVVIKLTGEFTSLEEPTDDLTSP
jgi:hypothetical protein